MVPSLNGLQPHLLAADEVGRKLQTDLVAGLTGPEAARRLTETGPNELPSAAAVSPWTILLHQFKNVLVAILLVAIVLSSILGHTVEAVAIAVITLFSVVLSFIQEYRADRALEALRRMAAPMATVVRDGEEMEAPGRELVAGDVILLTAGDLVPADARIVEAVNLRADEASLTGESIPVTKASETLADKHIAVGDRRNMVFCSTVATYGRGRAVVVATGARTEVGTIGSLLRTVVAARTPLERQMDRVGRWLLWAALAIVLVVIGLGVLRGRPVLDMLLFGIALAVAVVPEALPAVVTISLAIGAKLMAKRNALVRRLATVETLGSTTVICSDKTGTLTSGEMTVREVFVVGAPIEISGVGYDPQGAFLRGGSTTAPDEALVAFLKAGTLCSDAELLKLADSGRWRIKGDPTEAALIVAAHKAGIHKAALETECPRIGEIPFSSERKRMTTVHASARCAVSYSKGAPEVILESCARGRTADGEPALTPGHRESIRCAARAMAERGLRVLAVAERNGASVANAEQEMTFLGLAGMSDPPRPEAKLAIEACHRAGIRPIMITGDHPATALAIAGELGILSRDRVVTGAEIEAMNDDVLDAEVESIDVYARVSPAHKLRLVAALQAHGHVVAMTGDGVNDAPALKKADIGVAMGVTGTDVAKDAAAMILTDDNFASIVGAVEEGRAIVDNIRKYLMYLLSSNIGEIGLIAVSMVAGLPLPLTAVQILYVNLATDGLPALALAIDPHEPDLMRRRPRMPGSSILSRAVAIVMLTGGLWSTIANMSVFVWALRSGRSLAHAITMTFVSLVLIEFFKAYAFRAERHSMFRRPFANKWLNLAVVWELILLVMIVYIPFLQKPFGTFALGPVDWGVVLVAAVTILPVIETSKWMVRMGWFGAVE